MMKRTVMTALLLGLTVAGVVARVPRRPPVPQRSTIEIIEQVNDHWQQTHSPLVRSFWDEAAYHTGNMEAYRLLGHARWLDYSERWARHNRWQGARSADPAQWKYQQYGEGQDYVLFGDWQICFQTYLDLNVLEPAPFKTKRAIEVMDYEVRQPQCDFWWWADALYMVMPVMTKLYKATGEVKYLDKLYQNFCWADSLMFDKEVHLYYRDGRYIYPQHKTDLGKRDFWARGDGWVMAGLAKVLSDMPASYVHRPFFEQRFREVAEAVSQCQQPEGYWSRSMLDAEQAEGPETSGTAFFTYGLLWGMNHGLLSRERYEPVASRAWCYLTQRALQPSGAVGYVQPIGDRAVKGQQLSEKNEANFGVGAFLLAACEKLRFDEASAEGAASADARPASVCLTVRNASADFRHEVVETDAASVLQRLGISGGRQFVVRDAVGLEVPYQLTHDGQLLLEVSLQPHAAARFRVERGVPSVYPSVCVGRVYPERKDDYAWENDRGAYRVYGPALQQTGEKSYGIDVWTKNTPELVVEQRYWTEDVVMMPLVDQLRRENRHRGDSLYNTISYHHDHGRGLDPYKVGATLGCGAPALLAGSLVMPYCFRRCDILDNGPLRTSVQLTYEPTVVAGDTLVEHRVITLDKQSNLNRITVWYEGLHQALDFASGVVIHDEDTDNVVLARRYVAYADPTDNPPVINAPLFVAALFPDGEVATRREAGHALGVVNGYHGQKYTYYAGSAWSKYDVRSLPEWQQRIEWQLRAISAPLKVEVE